MNNTNVLFVLVISLKYCLPKKSENEISIYMCILININSTKISQLITFYDQPFSSQTVFQSIESFNGNFV